MEDCKILLEILLFVILSDETGKIDSSFPEEKTVHEKKKRKGNNKTKNVFIPAPKNSSRMRVYLTLLIS